MKYPNITCLACKKYFYSVEPEMADDFDCPFCGGILEEIEEEKELYDA